MRCFQFEVAGILVCRHVCTFAGDKRCQQRMCLDAIFASDMSSELDVMKKKHDGPPHGHHEGGRVLRLKDGYEKLQRREQSQSMTAGHATKVNHAHGPHRHALATSVEPLRLLDRSDVAMQLQQQPMDGQHGLRHLGYEGQGCDLWTSAELDMVAQSTQMLPKQELQEEVMPVAPNMQLSLTTLGLTVDEVHNIFKKQVLSDLHCPPKVDLTEVEQQGIVPCGHVASHQAHSKIATHLEPHANIGSSMERARQLAIQKSMQAELESLRLRASQQQAAYLAHDFKTWQRACHRSNGREPNAKLATIPEDAFGEANSAELAVTLSSGDTARSLQKRLEQPAFAQDGDQFLFGAEGSKVDEQISMLEGLKVASQQRQSFADFGLGHEVQSEPPDPMALRWAANNAWFGTDVEMTYFAFEVHDHLIRQGVGVDTEEYYAEISARVEADFPRKFFSPKMDEFLRQSSTIPKIEGMSSISPIYKQVSVLQRMARMYRQSK